MKLLGNRITVICGHYGCGKTNLTLNLALQAASCGQKVTVVDMDIVNPYFRSSEYRGLLEEKGVRLIAPVFAGTTLDTPTLPPEIASIFEPDAGAILIDAGGDDAGVTALGGLHRRLEEAGYDMLYVINRYRALSQTPEEAAAFRSPLRAENRGADRAAPALFHGPRFFPGAGRAPAGGLLRDQALCDLLLGSWRLIAYFCLSSIYFYKGGNFYGKDHCR